MDEQLSLFENNKNYTDSIFEILDQISKEMELPKDSLRLTKQDNKNEGQYVVEIFEPEFPEIVVGGVRKGVTSSVVLLKEAVTKKDQGKLTIVVLKSRYSTIEKKPAECEIKYPESSEYVTLVYNGPSEEYFETIRDIVTNRLKRYSSSASFGCCSQFSECLEKKKCVHVNKLYSTGCMYRRNLIGDLL